MQSPFNFDLYRPGGAGGGEEKAKRRWRKRKSRKVLNRNYTTKYLSENTYENGMENQESEEE